MFKKALSILLSVMLVVTSLSVAAVSVAAVDDGTKFIVAGSSLDIFGMTWNDSNEDNLMEAKEDGSYEIVYYDVAPEDNVQLKVVEKPADGSPAVWHGDKTGNNVTFNITADCDVTVNYNPATEEISVAGEYVEYVTGLEIERMVAAGNGDPNSDPNYLYGIGWDPGSAQNEMTEVEEGVYEITFENVSENMGYEIKFAAGSWVNNWGGTFVGSGIETPADYNGGNIAFDVEDDDSTIVARIDLREFDFASKKGAKFTITINDVIEEPPTEPEPETTILPDETEVPVTDAVTTVAEEETTVKADEPSDNETFSVKGTSNFFPEYTQVFDKDTDTVTVTYKLTSSKNLVNFEWYLSYDPEALRFDPALNMNEDYEWMIVPAAKSSVINADNPSGPGTINGNAASVSSLYKIASNDGKPVTLFTITFKVIDPKDSTVNLDVRNLTLGLRNPETMLLDPESEESVVKSYQKNPESTAVSEVATQVYEGEYDPDYTPATTPAVEETTVAEETTQKAEETTKPAEVETTKAAQPSEGSLKVTGTSNYFPKTVQSFTKEQLAANDDLVTVTYKINSPKNLLNTDWELNWDPTVLQYVEDYNVNEEWEQQVMPQVPDLILNANADKVENGRMLGNYSSASANHALTNNGEEVTFVTVTFKAIGEGDTTVDLNVKELTIVQRIKGKADPETSERVVTHNEPQEIQAAVTNNTYVYAGPYDPEYVPSETEPAVEETTEPVAEETTTAPVVEETTTAPVVEETTVVAPVDDTVYVVAGTPNFTGYNWNGSPDTGLILEPDGDGYSYTFENVDTVGDEMQVKVVGNAADGKQTWYGDDKGQNVTFKVTKPTDVKVYFDPATGTVSVSGDGVELIKDLEITNGVRIVGAADSGKGNWLNGISWNEKADENLMTEVSEKVYSITFNDLPEEMGYEFKIAANGSWNANWGIDAEKTEVVFNTPFDAAFNGNNITFDLDEDSDVTVVLDLTNFDYPTKEGAKITIKVTPSAEEETSEPVVEETTTEPAVEETTTAPVAEDTTVAPTPGSFLTVTGTSNYFPKTVQSFTQEELAAKDNLVTVTYKINSPKNLLNTDWELNWDPTVLQYVEDYNVNADWEQQVMPQVPDLILNANADKVENGRMLGNYSSASANHALTNNGEEVTFVTVTFKAIGEGDTTVDLNVKELTIVERIKGKADPTTSERVVTHNQPQDIETVVTNNTYVYAGPYDPDYVPSDEPTTVAEETTVPVVETTTEPVEETTTAPVVEETTTAPVVEETTTAPVEPTTEPTTAPVEDVVYVVAGTPNITGYNWNGSPDTGLILEPDGDGYSYTFENVDIVGDEIQVKVVGNAADGKQTWYGDEKGQNVTFKVTKPTDVKVYFDPATGIVSVSGDGVELITELDITNGIRIVGAADSGKGNWLNGISWNEKADENLMTEITDKVYSITFNDLPEEMGYEFKIAANGSWNANWGIDAEKTEVVFNTPFDAAFNGNNITFDLDEESDVTVVLDLTNFDYPTKEGAKITIKVTPSEEEVTTAPVVEETTTEPAVEETTTEPVVEETTTAPVAEETTVAPTPGSFLTVTGTSNYFPKTVQSFTKEELAAKDNLVTVTYKINSPKNLLNTDWELNWDPTVLKYVEDYNVNADWEQQVMPQVPDLILNANADKVENGRMLGNYSSASANHALTNNGEEVTFVTVTFEVIGEGDTTVDLNVKELTIVQRIKGKADPTTSERVVTHNQPQDIETAVTNNTYVYAGPYDPDYVPSDEPTTVAEETTEPVEETTTAPVVEETTTAPVVEETTTAPAEPTTEPTTAPVEDVVYVVAGTPNITGYNWNGSPDTGLILEPDGDGYSYTFENVDTVGDEMQVKVVGNAADGKQTWYGDEKGQNVTFKVTKPTDVKVYFDPATGIVSVSGDGVELITDLEITNGIRIVGAADSGKGNWLNGISWNEKADENLMTKSEAKRS